MTHFTFFQQAGLFVWVIIVGKWYSTPLPSPIFNLPLFSKNMLCTSPSIHMRYSCPYPTSLLQSTSGTPSIYPQLPVQLQPYHKVISPPISQCVKYVESKQWRHQNDAFETCNCQLGLDWKNQHHPDSNPSFKNCKNQSKYHGKINIKYSVLFCYPHPHSFYFQRQLPLPPLSKQNSPTTPSNQLPRRNFPLRKGSRTCVSVCVCVCVCVCMGRGCQLW